MPEVELDYALLFRELWAELNWIDARRVALNTTIEGLQLLVECDKSERGKP